MTSKILAASTLALVLAGCSESGSSPTAPAPTPLAPARVSTVGAARAIGDITPRRLVAVSIVAPTSHEVIHGSDALAPKKPFPIDNVIERPTAREMRRVMKGSDPASYTFPVDAPAGARVLVHAVDPKLTLGTVHLIDVATGRQLDRAREISATSINSRHVPTVATLPTEPAKDGKLVPATTEAMDPIAREPGFEAATPTLRRLGFDLPTTPGLVRLQVPAEAQAQGVWMELQQPNSHVTLSAETRELNYSFGDVAEVVATVMSDSTPIDGATIEGTIELPDHTTAATLAFAPAGNGTYVASVPLASADWKYIGVWGVRLHATGASTVQFERHVETAFGYYPAHAQIAALGTPVVMRGSDGSIDEISVDADVETLSDDRFSLRGTLTFVGADGAEHPLASAQTGQVVNAGKGTITLHFDAASLALAKVDGPFYLRDVALVSQAGSITQHRIGRGLGLATPAIKAREIRFPTVISIQAQDLIDNGDLEPIKLAR